MLRKRKLIENEPKVIENQQGLTETSQKTSPETQTETDNRTENRTVNRTENRTVNRTENRTVRGKKLTERQVSILQLIADNPYISKVEIGNILGVHPSSVWRSIEAMRGRYLRRVGADKNGFWEIIQE